MEYFYKILQIIKRVVVLLIFLFFISLLGNAQCGLTGPNNGSIAANDASVGTIAWSSTGNCYTSNNVYSNANALALGNNSNYLVVSGFGFLVPSTAVICGITVEMEKSASGLLANVKDNSIKIVKGGVITGTEKASGVGWPGVDGVVTYGGATDTWGTTWLYSDVNASDFGVAISVNLSGSLALPSALIDQIKITLHVDNTLPIELISFKANCIDYKKVKLEWLTASQVNNDYFSVERSEDGFNWEVIGEIDNKAYDVQLMNYSFIDSQPFTGPSYYRLKQTDLNKNVQYFNAVEIDCKDDEQVLMLYPNPTSDNITIESKDKGTLIIYNLLGEVVYTKNISNFNTQIDLTDYSKEIYFYRFISAYKIIEGKFLIN